MYVRLPHVCLSGHCGCQERASDLLEQESQFTGGSEPLYGCYELNPGSLQEQPVLVTAEPSLQPLLFVCLLYLSNSLRRFSLTSQASGRGGEFFHIITHNFSKG